MSWPVQLLEGRKDYIHEHTLPRDNLGLNTYIEEDIRSVKFYAQSEFIYGNRRKRHGRIRFDGAMDD